MRFFVTGVGGQLGHDVMNELLKRGHEDVGSDIQECYSGAADESAVTRAPYRTLDITDREAVHNVIAEIHPDVVFHCAAWTAVDLAEDEANIDKVRAINAGGTKNIADVCKELNCKMIYISTDYVFNGQGSNPWQPDCKDYAPLNVYGQTKLEGELAVSQILEKYFIVRIAWVFGVNGKNFIKTMLNVGKTHDTVRVVKLHGEVAVKRRIMDMGLTKGVEVHIRKVAPLGDPVEVTVRGYELSIRKADAEMIEVE